MADEAVWGYQLENYINIGTAEAEKYVKATELLTWDQSGEAKTYEPDWIDRKTPPTFTYGRSCSIEMEKDTIIGGDLDAWIFEHRNDIDVACDIVKVYTWEHDSTGKVVADKASFKFTPAPHSNSSTGQPVTGAGTFNMASEGWAPGTWDDKTKTFSDSAAVQSTPKG